MKWIALLALAAACGGETGTITVEVVAAPGGDLLERIERVRATLSSPREVTEAVRDEDGRLEVELEVTADGRGGSLLLEGYDADDELIALGISPPLPIAAVDASITVYLGPPGGFAEAPVELEPARSELGAAVLSYGAILMGGRDTDGDPRADVVVYNAYDHDLQDGLDLPAPRAAPTVLSGESNFVYVVGGEDEDGDASGVAWRFDTTVAPAGAYLELDSPDDDAARIGQSGVYVGGETFVVMGDPALAVSGFTLEAVVLEDAPALTDGVGVLLAGSPIYPALIAGAGVGDTGAVTIAGGVFEDLTLPDSVRRRGHEIVLLADARVLILGGEDEEGAPLASAILFDPLTGEVEEIDDFLATPRRGAAIAATFDHVVVAGGVDAGGALVPDAEVFDALTLDRDGTPDLVVPRRGAVLLSLGNGQLLLAGGTDAAGEPIGVLELYTPGG
ncbi:MAG TPA: kelch repeat-containing protein [Kofleriaceae bacterium]|nr:kelch repeat-containing protein [Kofleriaceae bacterium]